MKKPSFLYLIYLLITGIYFTSCTRRSDIDLTIQMQDSLRNICERMAMELQTDSLRNNAAEYLKVTQPYSRDYFKALQFQILADFNERNYDKVLENIHRTTLHPKFSDYEDINCHYEFTRARCYQYSGKFDQAIESFKNCLKFDSETDSLRESIRVITLNAMLQMMNTYINSGKADESAAYFTFLKDHPTPIINDYCQRDVRSLLAYSYYCIDSIPQAERYIEEALNMSMYEASPARKFRDYSYAAAIFYGNAQRHEEVVEWCHHAIDAAEEYEYTIGTTWTKALLGRIYYKMGHLDDALELYTKSAVAARSSGDFKGEANAYNSLANLYLYWEQYPHANEYATIALNNNLNQPNRDMTLCGESYVMKGLVMSKMGVADSSIYYWNKADSCFADLSYASGSINVDKHLGAFYVDQEDNKNLQEGIDRLRRVLRSSAWYDRAPSYFLLAKGLIRQNKAVAGEAMLDSMYHILNSSSSPLFVDEANKYALQHYLDKNDQQNIQRYAKLYLQETESKLNDVVAKKVTEAMIEYQTERKEQQLLLTQAELEQQELRVKLYILILICLFAVLCSFLIWSFHKRRYYHLRHQLVEQRCQNLLKNMEVVTQRSRETESQLSELLSNKESRMEIASVAPALYRQSGETKFRERFSQLHPTFLPKLKERVPNITHSEEVLCMLIVLDQTTEQMIDILCIARSSVNMARHRLRKKMELNKEDSLEDVIKILL